MADDPEFTRELAEAISPYRSELESFVRGELTADEFEERYLEIYKADPSTGGSDQVFDAVDGFFADVDAYVSNPKIRDPEGGDLGPEDLRKRARDLLQRAGS